MLEQIAKAIERQNYQTAAQLLENFQQQEPENPWLGFYLARLDEANGKLQAAQQSYRQLLKNTSNLKIISQARQGIERIAKIEKQQRQQDLAHSLAEPGNQEFGVLVLESIAPQLKKTAAQKFARIMQLDPYTARLQLPTRSWRLYRTGKLGELKCYVSDLKKAEIPCFCHSLAEISQIKVYQVSYFQSTTPQATVICYCKRGQEDKITFDWQEVSQKVEGLLPLFEASLHQDVRGKLYRKKETLDYVQLCDLHLPRKKIILRLCDRSYKFHQGMSFSNQSKSSHSPKQITARNNWNNLNNFLRQQLPEIPVWSDFTPFAETAIGFQDMLGHIQPHINLLRREETPWDAAFELYSGLVFFKSFQLK